MQETINKLRDRPKEDRVAIASTIAIGVVAILLVGWFFFFIHGLGQSQLQYTRTAQDTSQQNDQTRPPAGESSVASSSSTIVPVSTIMAQASSTDTSSTDSATDTSAAPAKDLNGY